MKYIFATLFDGLWYNIRIILENDFLCIYDSLEYSKEQRQILLISFSNSYLQMQMLLKYFYSWFVLATLFLQIVLKSFLQAASYRDQESELRRFDEINHL